MNKQITYRYFLNKKHKPGWWKHSTKLIASIEDKINNFQWFIYVGKDLQPAVDMFSKALGVRERWDSKNDGGQVGHFFAYRDHRAGAIWFETPPHKTPDVLAHECFHAVMYLVEKMESKATEDQEEFMAYYLGFLVGQIDKICRNLA